MLCFPPPFFASSTAPTLTPRVYLPVVKYPPRRPGTANGSTSSMPRRRSGRAFTLAASAWSDGRGGSHGGGSILALQLVFKQNRRSPSADCGSYHRPYHTYGFADQTKESLGFVLPGTGGPVERTIGFEYHICSQRYLCRSRKPEKGMCRC